MAVPSIAPIYALFILIFLKKCIVKPVCQKRLGNSLLPNLPGTKGRVYALGNIYFSLNIKSLYVIRFPLSH